LPHGPAPHAKAAPGLGWQGAAFAPSAARLGASRGAQRRMTVPEQGIKPQRASALGHTDPSVVPSPRNPVLDSVDACSFCPVAPVMPPVRRGLPSSEEDRLSARIPDACPEPTRATAVLLVPDPEFDGAMQTDPFAGGAYKNVSLRGQGQAQQNCNQRACNKALNGGV
jgi:hypothetical protein